MEWCEIGTNEGRCGAAEGCFRHLQYIFVFLDECRAFEILRTYQVGPVCTAIYVSPYCCVCVRTYQVGPACTAIYVSSYCCICVRTYQVEPVCTAIYVSSYCHMCPHTAVCDECCVLILLYTAVYYDCRTCQDIAVCTAMRTCCVPNLLRARRNARSIW